LEFGDNAGTPLAFDADGEQAASRLYLSTASRFDPEEIIESCRISTLYLDCKTLAKLPGRRGH
jgi:hypothetical protein